MQPPDTLFEHAVIKRHFAKAAAQYSASAVLQRDVETRLLESVEYIQKTPTRILDLGAGPGRASTLLKKRWPKAEIIALDLALPMLQQFEKPKWFSRPIKRVCASALQLPIQDNAFDLVFSSLCLQWAHPLPTALAEIRRVLRPNGMLCFSTFGPETLLELRDAYIQIGQTPAISPFAAIQQIGDGLQASGFRNAVLDRDLYTMTYPNLRALMRELQAIGANDARAERTRGLMGKNAWLALDAAYPRVEQRVPSTWEIITAMAFKPEPRTNENSDIVASIDVSQITRRERR